MLEKDFDFKNPDYGTIFQRRFEVMEDIRKVSKTRPSLIPNLKKYYSDNPLKFINDWGTTFDPRNAGTELPSLMPFILLPRQEEMGDWALERYENKEDGIVLKTREIGASAFFSSLSCTKALHEEGFIALFTSYKAAYVDELGNQGSLLEKCRDFLRYLPPEFSNYWNEDLSKFKQVSFRNSSSKIIGDMGKNIARGNRISWAFIDEFAAFEPSIARSTDSSMVSATKTKFYVSTSRGSNNSFAEKVLSIENSNDEKKKKRLFRFSWQMDPRKSEEWYKNECEKIDNPVIVAQELDCDLYASVSGILIPIDWVRASIDAHIKLGIEPSGARWASLDIADEGKDKNALCGVHGFLIETLDEWSGKGSDIFQTIEKTFEICSIKGYEKVYFDSDGLGAAARGDAAQINDRRTESMQIEFIPFRGSGSVIDPEGEVFKGEINSTYSQKEISRKNQDYFKNRKAQGYFDLKERFKNTYRAVVEGKSYDIDSIISIDSKLSLHLKLTREISQPIAKQLPAGHFIIDKSPDGSSSPNLADSAMMAFAKQEPKHWSAL